MEINMKKFAILGIALALVGCNSGEAIQKTGVQDQTRNFEAICIDGVQYWLSIQWGNASVMSPRISPKTGRYMSCPAMVAPVVTEIQPAASEGIDASETDSVSQM
jgi:hypothetical protein